jgi:hypothetical protein
MHASAVAAARCRQPHACYRQRAVAAGRFASRQLWSLSHGSNTTVQLGLRWHACRALPQLLRAAAACMCCSATAACMRCSATAAAYTLEQPPGHARCMHAGCCLQQLAACLPCSSLRRHLRHCPHCRVALVHRFVLWNQRALRVASVAGGACVACAAPLVRTVLTFQRSVQRSVQRGACVPSSMCG